MKTLFKPLIVLLCTAVAFSSCMKDTSAEDEARQREAEQKLLAQFEAEAIDIEEFKYDNASEAPGGWQKDDTDFQFPTLGKTIKRGIWFEVINEPELEEEDMYKYELTQNGSVTLPKVKVTYSVSLLDGSVVQSGINKEIELSTIGNSTSEVFNQIWIIAFRPKTIEYNEQEYPTFGLTSDGLQKGSHIRLITPSYFAFGNNKVGDIPANSPLVYEFEVLDIIK